MAQIESISDLVNLWPKAADLGADVGVTDLVVRAWKRRDAIPGEYWKRIVEAAAKRGFKRITLDLLAELAARKAAA